MRVYISLPAATAQASTLKVQITELRLKNLRFERFKLAMFEIADSCPAKLQATFSPEDIAATLVQESRVSYRPKAVIFLDQVVPRQGGK